jgi:O-antigen/teichoic acid export membrane protein
VEKRMKPEPSEAPPARNLPDTLKGETRSVFVLQIASQIISLIVIAILYRVVSRADFGFLGMIMPVVMLVRMLAAQSLNIATVQSASLDMRQHSSLFWIATIVGLTSSLVVSGIAPILAWIYEVQDVLPVAIALGWTIFLVGISIQHQAILEREMKIGKVAWIKLIGQTSGGIAAIVAGMAEWGVWALVLQQYVELIVSGVLFWLASGFFPHWRLSFVGLGGELKFGGLYTASNLVFYLGQNIDKLILAALLGQTPLGREIVGMYSQAYQQMMKPVYLVSLPITSLMFPALSRSQNDPIAFKEICLRFYRLIVILLAPCTLGLCLTSVEVFELLGGAEWKFAGYFLSIMSASILAQGMINMCGSVYGARQRGAALLISATVITLLLTIGYLVGFYAIRQWKGADEFGAMGMAAGLSLVTSVAVWIPYIHICFKSNGLKAKDLWHQVKWPLLSSAIMAVVVLLVSFLLEPLQLPVSAMLAVKSIIGAVTYIGLTRKDLSWAKQQLSNR